jgi:OOP family OmpA-OmpF porin
MFRSEPVETDLASRARGAIAAAVPATAGATSVTARGRDVLIEGPEFEAGQGAKAALAVLQNDGVRLVVQRFHPVPTAKPFEFSAVRTGNELVLTGSVPSPAVREKLLAAARSGAAGATVVDKMTYALGAPDGFEAIAIRGLTEAAKLDGGAFALADAAYSISGTAKSTEAFEAAIAATRQLPAGAILAKVDIAPAESTPPSFSVTSDAAAVTIKGAAPSIEVRAALAAAASASLPGRTIVNQMEVTRGASNGDFAAWASYGLTQLSRLSKGSVAISDGAVSIEGEAGTPQSFEAAIAGTRQLPAGLKLAHAEIVAPEIKPYGWGATSDGHSVTLSGLAPNLDVRSAIAASAAQRFPGRTIVDQIGIARGAPNGDFAAWAIYGLSELGRLTKGHVAISDGAYSIEGEAGTSQAFEAAIAGTAQLPAGLKLTRADILAPEVKPYAWEASSNGHSVTLSGFAPSADIRAAIAASAAHLFPDRSIVNRIEIARGAPNGDFIRAATGALTELAKLSEGHAVIADAQVRISGQGPAGSGAAVSASARASMPTPFSVAAIDIKEPAISQPPSATLQEPARSPELAKSEEPARPQEPAKSQERAKSQEAARVPFEFILDKEDGRIKLSGHVPDDKARGDLIAAAKAVFSHEQLVDELKIGKGAPADLVKALEAILPSLARLRSGTLTLNDAGLTAHGLVDDKSVADEIKTALADATPSGFKMGDVTIAVLPPAPAPEVRPSVPEGNPCQAASDGVLLRGRILFGLASAKITEEAQPLLDNLIDVARHCGDAKIEVSGYTDYLGYDDFNIDLSKRRAQAVVDAITRAGIDASRISSAGYGESKPAVSNDTHEGRVQNRRIEFLVK